MAYTPDTGTSFYKHTQAVLAATWTIDHNLGFHPSVHVEDAVGNVVFGSVKHVSDSSLTVTFTSGITGSAYCS